MLPASDPAGKRIVKGHCMMRLSKRRWVLMAFGAVAGLLLVVSVAQAGKITLGKPMATADGGLDVSVNVTPDSGQDVAALQFDLHYDGSQYGFADAVSGGAATGAGKDAVVSETEAGMVRVVVAGVNQETLGSGTIATLHFDRIDKTSSLPAFSDNAILDEVVASGPYGENVEGLDVSAAVSESASATANESNGKTGSPATSSSAPTGTTKTPVTSGATGTNPALEPGARTSTGTNPRATICMGALTEARGGSQGSPQSTAPGLPETSRDFSPRQIADNPRSGIPLRVASASSANGSHTHRAFAKVAGVPPNAGDKAIPGRSTRVTSAIGMGAGSPSIPAVAVSRSAGNAVKMNDSPNSGIFPVLAVGVAALALMVGAWVLRRN